MWIFFNMLLLHKTLHFDGLESGSPLNEGKEAFDFFFFKRCLYDATKLGSSVDFIGAYLFLCVNFQQFSCYFEFQ